MELKQYQQDTLNDLAAYMEQLQEDNDLQKAYKNFWLKKGIDISNIESNQFLHSYDNTIKGVPRVMFKVPTAGGKTFIACNALKVIFDHLPADRPKVVAWFVPSDSILKQTYKNLGDADHPYCQRIKSHFNNRVTVVDKETALSGVGIQPTQIQEQLTIFVLSVQSFAANNKDGRRVFRENSSLAAYATTFGNGDKIEGADETSLIQAIAHLNPVVIIDESHNFEAKLRIELFEQINPSFILDLTATPRQKSNIISFVDAKKLKDANMVKLPIVLYNRDNVTDVLFNAITLRNNLEKRAVELRKNGGRYIRPIVLVQAQPKNDKDNETFEKVKQKLIEAGIPENHIKIKTADKDELKGQDLMSEDCETRYIITVNALKEGWDCPFAYILASLANKTSRIDVEQIVGRVLRLPYTTKHKDEFLNLSYVFTSSNNFRETVESVIKGLNNAGFSSKDTRFVIPEEPSDPITNTAAEPEISFGNNPNDNQEDNQETDSQGNTNQHDDSQEDNNFDPNWLKEKLQEETEEQQNDSEQEESETEKPASPTDEILQQAHDANTEYEEESKADDSNNHIPSDMKGKIATYQIKDDFKEIATALRLPVFTKEVNIKTVFNPETKPVRLTKAMLTEGFELEKADKNINFTRSDQEAVRIDLEERSKGEFVPKQYKMNDKQLHAIRELFVSYNVESKRNQLTGKIAKRLHFDTVNEPHISNYIKSVLQGKSDEELVELFDNDLMTERAFKQKIDSLVAEYQHNNFKKMLDKMQITCKSDNEEAYQLPKTITPGKTAIGLSKGLYIEEDGDMNNFEYRIINSVTNLENVLFWHRNSERTKDSFCINGFIYHYPDFIIYTQKGNIILLETKGDDRDNSDSINKIDLGSCWANKAGDKFHYFMVFDTTQCNGAKTKEEFLDILKEL